MTSLLYTYRSAFQIIQRDQSVFNPVILTLHPLPIRVRAVKMSVDYLTDSSFLKSSCKLRSSPVCGRRRIMKHADQMLRSLPFCVLQRHLQTQKLSFINFLIPDRASLCCRTGTTLPLPRPYSGRNESSHKAGSVSQSRSTTDHGFL